MGVKDDLIAAKALIDTPEKWGKNHGVLMLTLNGSNDQSIKVIIKRCAGNALVKVGASPLAFRAVERQVPLAFADVPSFNDHPETTHADIMALFNRAIATATDGEAGE